MNIQHPHIGRKPGDPGPVDHAAVNGTVTLKYPGTGDKVYADSVFEIIVELTLTGSDALPAGAAATIALGPNNADYGISGNPTRPFVQESAPPGAKATATFYVIAPPLPTDPLTFTVESADPTLVTFTPLSPPAITADPATLLGYAYSDSDPLWLNTPFTGIPPFISPPPHTIAHYTVTIKDGGTPVQNYLVEWQQRWDSDAFDTNVVKAFGGNTFGDLLAVDYRDYAAKKFGVVRSKTNAQGVAELYIAPRDRGAYFDLKCAAPQQTPRTGQDLSSVIVIGPSMFDVASPFLVVPDNNLDKVVGNFVSVGVSVPNNAAQGTPLTYLLFVNKNLVGYQSITVGDPNQPIYIPVGKTAFKSIDDPSNGQNLISYAVAGQSLGELTSQTDLEVLSGNKGQNIPQPGLERPLLPPWIPGAGAVITRNTIQGDPVCKIRVIRFPGFWTPKPGDVITGTLYPNGWDDISHEPKGIPVPVTWPTITAPDILQGEAHTTISRYMLQDYGPEQFTGTLGTLYFDAYVQVQGTGPKIYAQINQYLIDT
jgi:hypothetical protein